MIDINFYKEKAVQSEIDKIKSYNKKNDKDFKKNSMVLETDSVSFNKSSSTKTNDLLNKRLRSSSLNNLGSTYTKIDQLFSEESSYVLHENKKAIKNNFNNNLKCAPANLDKHINCLSQYSIPVTNQHYCSYEIEEFNNDKNSNNIKNIYINSCLKLVLTSSFYQMYFLTSIACFVKF